MFIFAYNFKRNVNIFVWLFNLKYETNPFEKIILINIIMLYDPFIVYCDCS